MVYIKKNATICKICALQSNKTMRLTFMVCLWILCGKHRMRLSKCGAHGGRKAAHMAPHFQVPLRHVCCIFLDIYHTLIPLLYSQHSPPVLLSAQTPASVTCISPSSGLSLPPLLYELESAHCSPQSVCNLSPSVAPHCAAQKLTDAGSAVTLLMHTFAVRSRWNKKLCSVLLVCASSLRMQLPVTPPTLCKLRRFMDNRKSPQDTPLPCSIPDLKQDN